MSDTTKLPVDRKPTNAEMLEFLMNAEQHEINTMLVWHDWSVDQVVLLLRARITGLMNTGIESRALPNEVSEWDLIQELTETEGCQVTICNPNPDFDPDGDDYAIYFSADFGQNEHRFGGDSYLDCLKAAKRVLG